MKSLYHASHRWWLRHQVLQSVGTRARGATSSRAVTYLTSAGLGNRLRAHLIAQRYAALASRTLRVMWPATKHLNGNVSDLLQFAEGDGKERFSTARVVPYVKGQMAPQGDCRFDYEEDLVVFDFAWQFVDSAYLIERLEECPGWRNWIQPSRRVADRVEARTARFGKHTVGIHIRQGDFVTHTGQAIQLDRYVACLERIVRASSDTDCVFIATDGTPDVVVRDRKSVV